ncbi:MAG: cadmium-translocating P-type ATPase [Planctomycetes bacterium]|nr:cadmium-translocating P-type ATPase [Planctomycetota bacterium]
MPETDTQTSIHLCGHCGLPVAASGHQGEVAGVWQRFCCYGCYLCQRIIGEKGEAGLTSWLLAQLGLSWFFAMDIMMIAVARYTGGFEGVDPSTVRFFEWTEFGLATPIVFMLGVPYLWRSFKSLSRGSVNADVLIALGAIASYAFSTWQLLTQDNPILYYDSGTMILVFVNFGRYIEAAARRRTASGIRELSAAELGKARRKSAGAITEVAAGELAVGDEIVLEPGATLPADGVITRGHSQIPEALITGEERPVPKNVGDSVLAGTINGDAEIEVRVTAVGTDTVRSRIVQLTKQALLHRTAFESAVDKVSRAFVPLVIALAIGSAAWWTWRGDAGQGALVALSILVVACPCALGLAVPMASALALGRASELGILIRDGSVLENLARVRHVLFDKTGTLTQGAPTVSRVDAEPGIDASRVLALAAAVEAQSEHWLGKAIVRKAGGAGARAEDFRAMPGQGVEGRVEGKLVRVGNAQFCAAPPSSAPLEGATEVCVSEDGALLGRLWLDDVLKQGARKAVDELVELGLGVQLVTGDGEQAARRVAREAGIRELQFRQSPQDKLKLVESLGATTVAMTGDGLNDGPALMAAGVGITFAEATGLARIASGLTLIGQDLSRLPLAVRLARRTLVIMWLNLFWAFSYNAVAVALAVAGKLAPWHAALAMLLSSLFVIGNSWRLRDFGRNVAPQSGRESAPREVVA